MERKQIVAVVILIIFLVLNWIHFGVAGSGKKAHDYPRFDKLFAQHMGFIITCTIVTYLIAAFLLIDFLCMHCLSRKWQVILIALLLILEFALAVDVAIVASQASIWVDDFKITTSSAEDHRNWGVADSVLSWVIKVPTLAYLFYTAVDDLENGVVDAAVDAPAPPPTADRMN